MGLPGRLCRMKHVKHEHDRGVLLGVTARRYRTHPSGHRVAEQATAKIEYGFIKTDGWKLDAIDFAAITNRQSFVGLYFSALLM